MRRPALPSPAFCLALLALFVSLGGTTYAITSLPRDSVGPAQIRDRAVTESELSNASVITRKLANGAVVERKIAPGAITGSRVAADSLGGVQIDESSLLAVPFAQQAETAKLAARAQVADRVERVARADTAGTADRATLADRATDAENAEQAEQADRAAVSDRIAVVDTNLDFVVLQEGQSTDFLVDCDAEPDYVAIAGGWGALGDLADLPTVTGASVGSGWLVQVADDADPGGVDAQGFVYAVCVKAEDET
jgi:hypothetical protein